VAPPQYSIVNYVIGHFEGGTTRTVRQLQFGIPARAGHLLSLESNSRGPAAKFSLRRRSWVVTAAVKANAVNHGPRFRSILCLRVVEHRGSQKTHDTLWRGTAASTDFCIFEIGSIRRGTFVFDGGGKHKRQWWKHHLYLSSSIQRANKTM